jgi:mannosyl-3-phosphoglycerate phosphatase
LAKTSSREDSRLLVFSDLDGTLLDHETYSFRPALPAIRALKEKNVPLIICTSKTKAEIEETRKQLHITHPFISENGGAIFIPKKYFHLPFSFDKEDKNYLIIELGTSYQRIRKILSQIQTAFPGKVRGFGDFTAKEVASLCGLSLGKAKLAKKREYDEPFLLDDKSAEESIEKMANLSNLHLTKGGRFFHLLGGNDKGKAVSMLKALYKKEKGQIKTVGLGDSLNDLPMLKVVDYPVLVAKPDRGYDPTVILENMVFAKGIGPYGWNKAVLELLEKSAY